jgi:hypothetical protein
LRSKIGAAAYQISITAVVVTSIKICTLVEVSL